MAELHKYFFQGGFNITGVEQVLYLENTSIQFNENEGLNTLGFSSFGTIWDFYNSKTGVLIKSVVGTSNATTSFTYTEGRDGIDVKMTVNFGIHQTIFKKRHRIIIMRDKSTPTRTITINTLPRYGGGTAFTVDCNVTNGSTTITTVGAHGISVDEPILLTQGGTSYTYRAISGTSGSTIIIEQPFQGSTGTVTAANAYHGLNLELLLDAASWSAGDRTNLTGTVYCNRVVMKNFNGTLTDPIQVSIPDGDTHVTMTKCIGGPAGDDIFTLADNQNHTHFYMDKDSSGNRKFELHVGGMSVNHFSTGDVYGNENLRFGGWAVYNAKSSAFKLKCDSATRANGGFDDAYVFDNLWDTAANEGIYFGYFTYGYVTSKYYPSQKRFKCWGNTAINTGWDGIQVACADEATEVHDNYCDNNGTAEVSSQDFSFSINEGFEGHFYNNYCGRKIQIQPYKTTYVYNNFIRGTGEDFAIFIRRSDNPLLGTPSYPTQDANADLYIFNNLMLCAKDAMYLVGVNDDSTGIVELRDLYYFNNALNFSGTPNADGEYREQDAVGTVVIKSNYKPASINSLGIEDVDNLDVDLLQTSEVFDAANEGIDVSAYVAATDLPLQMFTDISGRVIPDRGYWKQSHLHRPNGFDTLYFQPNKTAIQWYKTAQSSVFSDKEKLSDYFGYKIKTTQEILDSAKPLLVASVKPVALTGSKYGVETFDDVSN